MQMKWEWFFNYLHGYVVWKAGFGILCSVPVLPKSQGWECVQAEVRPGLGQEAWLGLASSTLGALASGFQMWSAVPGLPSSQVWSRNWDRAWEVQLLWAGESSWTDSPGRTEEQGGSHSSRPPPDWGHQQPSSSKGWVQRDRVELPLRSEMHVFVLRGRQEGVEEFEATCSSFIDDLMQKLKKPWCSGKPLTQSWVSGFLILPEPCLSQQRSLWQRAWTRSGMPRPAVIPPQVLSLSPSHAKSRLRLSAIPSPAPPRVPGSKAPWALPLLQRQWDWGVGPAGVALAVWQGPPPLPPVALEADLGQRPSCAGN